MYHPIDLPFHRRLPVDDKNLSREFNKYVLRIQEMRAEMQDAEDPMENSLEPISEN